MSRRAPREGSQSNAIYFLLDEFGRIEEDLIYNCKYASSTFLLLFLLSY
jgi:hypothetical protein